MADNANSQTTNDSSTQEQPAVPATPAQSAPAAPPVVPTKGAVTVPDKPGEQKTQPTVEDGAFGPSVKYAKTGNQNLDMALEFAGKHGLSDQHPAMKAAMDGNFGPIKAILAEKGIAGWEAHVALAEQGFNDLKANKESRDASTRSMAVDITGSEEDLQAVLDWTSQNADPDEKKVLNMALESGGILAEAVIRFLSDSYRNAAGTSTPPQQSAVRQDASGKSATALTPLSPRDYGLAVQELRRTKGERFESSREYAILNQRRMAYRG